MLQGAQGGWLASGRAYQSGLALRPMVRACCAARVLVVAAGVHQSGRRGLGRFRMGLLMGTSEALRRWAAPAF